MNGAKIRGFTVLYRGFIVGVKFKYLCKVATAGSKEARQLEKVKKIFAEAYRTTEAKTNTAQDGGVRYSISRTQDMSWAEQINGALYDGKNIRRNDTLVAGNSADTSIGSEIDSKPLAIPLSVLSKASSGKDVSHSIKRGKLAKLDSGIKNAPITIVNPERNAVVYITDIKQGGLPIVVAFDMNTTFDGDEVHKATSIHLQVDVGAMIKNLPASATVYIQKNELDPVGATNNLRGLAAKIKFIDKKVPQKTPGVKGQLSLSGENDIAPPRGNFRITGKDISLEGVPIRSDITPVKPNPALEGVPIRKDIAAATTQKTDVRIAAEAKLSDAAEMEELGVMSEYAKMQALCDSKGVARSEDILGRGFVIQKKSNGKYVASVEGLGSGLVAVEFSKECDSFDEAYVSCWEYIFGEDSDFYADAIADATKSAEPTKMGDGRRLTENDLADYMRVGERKHVRDAKQQIVPSAQSLVKGDNGVTPTICIIPDKHKS